MKNFTQVLLFLIASPAFADFERPLFKNSQTLEDSEIVEDEKVKLNCFVFKKYIILEREEPGFIGKNIYFKEKSPGKANGAFCDDIKIETFTKASTSGSSFYGLYRKFLFAQDPDELSARTKFEIMNLETGVITYSGVKNNDTILKIIPTGAKTTAIEYFQRYAADCDFNSKTMDLKCWSHFLSSIEVPEKVKIPYPNCPKTKNAKKYQIFLKVQVADVQKSKRTFLWSKPVCEIAP